MEIIEEPSIAVDLAIQLPDRRQKSAAGISGPIARKNGFFRTERHIETSNCLKLSRRSDIAVEWEQ